LQLQALPEDAITMSPYDHRLLEYGMLQSAVPTPQSRQTVGLNGWRWMMMKSQESSIQLDLIRAIHARRDVAGHRSALPEPGDDGLLHVPQASIHGDC